MAYINMLVFTMLAFTMASINGADKPADMIRLFLTTLYLSTKDRSDLWS
jgi:hypothetical protein